MKPTLDQFGREVGSDETLTLPTGFKRPETLAEQVQRLVRTSVSAYAEANGQETFEESEDFDVDDDFDFRTPFEEEFDPILGKGVTAAEIAENPDIYRERYIAATEAYSRMNGMLDEEYPRNPPVEEGGTNTAAPSSDIAEAETPPAPSAEQ